jgi:hypothetical protein
MDRVCPLCISLRNEKLPIQLSLFDWQDIDILGMCRKCFEFIQKPENNDAIQKWEERNEKKN